MASQKLVIIETRRSLYNVDEIATYYEKEQKGLGSRFVQYYYNHIDYLISMPNIGRSGKVFGTRELVLNEFPYLVVYRIRQNRLEILRILHQMRHYPKKCS